MKKQLYVEIGNRLREKRESVGYTREKLAELADLSSRFIANIELGDNGVSIETLKKLCELLGVSCGAWRSRSTQRSPASSRTWTPAITSFWATSSKNSSRR